MNNSLGIVKVKERTPYLVSLQTLSAPADGHHRVRRSGLSTLHRDRVYKSHPIRDPILVAARPMQVEIKTTKDTPDIGSLQKAADFVQAFLLGASLSTGS